MWCQLSTLTWGHTVFVNTWWPRGSTITRGPIDARFVINRHQVPGVLRLTSAGKRITAGNSWLRATCNASRALLPRKRQRRGNEKHNKNSCRWSHVNRMRWKMFFYLNISAAYLLPMDHRHTISNAELVLRQLERVNYGTSSMTKICHWRQN